MNRLVLLGALLVNMLTASSCKTASANGQSEVKVTNGVEVSADSHPAVVMLVNDNDSLCTGVFINDHQVLTAAHCVANRREVRIVQDRFLSTLLGFKTIATSVRLAAHPAYKTRSDNAKDLGLISFPPKTGLAFATIGRQKPAVGEAIWFVGFGVNVIYREMPFGVMRQDGANLKRLGRNRILRIDNDVLVFRGVLSSAEASAAGIAPGDQAGFAGGDSGGPVFNARNELVGIISAGTPQVSGDDRITAMDNLVVDLTSKSSIDFLAQTKH